MDQGGAVLAQACAPTGMGGLTPAGFEPALLALVGDWLRDAPMDVVACGMVGSRQGWVEAPYTAAPCALAAPTMVRAPSHDPRLRVQVISGIKQMQPADVMRGEEMQIAGFLAQSPRFDGIICLPGTHTKWVHISAAEVVSFQTFLTGELFATLCDHSVLRHSVAAGGWDDAAFDAGLSEGYARPEKFAARLFSLRAEGLLAALPAAQARARLSGLLIGVELAAARPYWLGQQIAVIGAGALARLYVRALAAQGVPATQVNADGATLAGLTAAYRQMKG